MQYFPALKLGQKRVEKAREYLNKLTDGKAMPALALKDTKSDVWEPVGEEILYAIVDESSGFVLTDTSGYIVAMVDNNGISKAIVQGVRQEQKENLIKSFESDNIPEFKGKVSLPV
jgi:cytochrome oxidase Cu insertion factor (SCO1/SenC/PrrC family)